jgi:hypothetical protein
MKTFLILTLVALWGSSFAQTPAGSVYTHQYTDLRSMSYLVDFSAISNISGHNNSAFWDPPPADSPPYWPYMDIKMIPYTNPPGECWQYRWAQQDAVPMPMWRFWTNKGSNAAPVWQPLNGTKVNVWVASGGSSTLLNFLRLSAMALNHHSTQGSAWLHMQKMPSTQSSCLGTTTGTTASLLYQNSAITIHSPGQW